VAGERRLTLALRDRQVESEDEGVATWGSCSKREATARRHVLCVDHPNRHTLALFRVYGSVFAAQMHAYATIGEGSLHRSTSKKAGMASILRHGGATMTDNDASERSMAQQKQ
jgi:hypothetical protein